MVTTNELWFKLLFAFLAYIVGGLITYYVSMLASTNKNDLRFPFIRAIFFSWIGFFALLVFVCIGGRKA